MAAPIQLRDYLPAGAVTPSSGPTLEELRAQVTVRLKTVALTDNQKRDLPASVGSLDYGQLQFVLTLDSAGLTYIRDGISSDPVSSFIPRVNALRVMARWGGPFPFPLRGDEITFLVNADDATFARIKNAGDEAAMRLTLDIATLRSLLPPGTAFPSSIELTEVIAALDAEPAERLAMIAGMVREEAANQPPPGTPPAHEEPPPGADTTHEEPPAEELPGSQETGLQTTQPSAIQKAEPPKSWWGRLNTPGKVAVVVGVAATGYIAYELLRPKKPEPKKRRRSTVQQLAARNPLEDAPPPRERTYANAWEDPYVAELAAGGPRIEVTDDYEDERPRRSRRKSKKERP